MSQTQPIPSSVLIVEIAEQCSLTTPKRILQSIVTQIERAEEAKRRIEDEGIVVRDLKGSVLPHPAIKIEADAQKIICDLLTKHKRREVFKL